MGGQDDAGPSTEGISCVAAVALAEGIAGCAGCGGGWAGCVKGCAVLADSIGVDSVAIIAGLAGAGGSTCETVGVCADGGTGVAG